MRTTKSHHYVPEWYQRRFLSNGKGNFFVLDKFPDKFIDCPDGKKRPITPKEIFSKGPNALFEEPNLYAISFPLIPKDFIENFIFGEIDAKGALANELYNQWPEIKSGMLRTKGYEFPDRFGDIGNQMKSLLNYIDAQKFRTPRGIQNLKNFLSIHRTQTNQNSVMNLMLKRRAVNCTVWSEGIWEIFSTENEEICFLLSDDPVTFYNCDCYPGSSVCKYPNEPHPFWRGTRVLHPLSPNHLLVISHCEHVDNPSRRKARDYRTNARSWGDSLINWSAIDNYRTLNSQQVNSINHIIKERAIRYIAALNKEDLYPEKKARITRWTEIDDFFQPEFRSFHSSSKMIIGYKDGSSLHSDAFGRMTRVPNWFERQARKSRKPY